MRASSNTIDTRSCSAKRLLEPSQRSVGVAARRRQQSATASGSGEGGRPVEPPCPALDQIEQCPGLVQPAERDQRLDVVEHETHRTRLSDPALLEPLGEGAELPMRRAGIPQRELEQADRRRGEDARHHHTAFIGEGERRAGVDARVFDVAPGRPHQCAHREREDALRLLAGLQRGLVALLGVTARLLQAPREELDPSQEDQDPRQAALLATFIRPPAK